MSLKSKLLFPVVVIALLALATSAKAVILGPNSSAAPTGLTVGAITPINDTGVQPYTAVGGSPYGYYEEVVWSDPLNTFCTGCYDFLYQVTNTLGDPDNVTRISTSSFAGFSTDVRVVRELHTDGRNSCYGGQEPRSGWRQSRRLQFPAGHWTKLARSGHEHLGIDYRDQCEILYNGVVVGARRGNIYMYNLFCA